MAVLGSQQKAVLYLTTIGLFPSAIVFLFKLQDTGAILSLLISSAVSCVGFFATKKVIPYISAATLRRGLSGLDINKKGSKEGEKPIPEALGLAPGVIFLVCIILFQLLHSHDISSLLHSLQTGESIKHQPAITDAWLVDYNAALATICFMLFLGFADDVLDIPWRVKLLLPLLASLPLLLAYGGGTEILLPKPIRPYAVPVRAVLQGLGIEQGHVDILQLGFLYRLYMMALTVFCTNSINILAGVNGLEAGQTLVVACAVLFHNLLELSQPATTAAVRDGHLFSAYLMLPLIFTTAGLLTFNWYPSRVFVGDTFTYFAGMTFAVAGILGHYSETMLLFLIPQVFNFVYSIPQLFKWVPCPRHRLPKYDPSTGLLHATPNYNLVNLTLQVMGPCTEPWLCIRILSFQAMCCVAAFVLRHFLSGIYK